MAAATGLWDKAAKAYLQPAPQADETHPGGAGTLAEPTALFNVAFRFDEPVPGTPSAHVPRRHRPGGATTRRARRSPRTTSRRSSPRSTSAKLRAGETDRMFDEPTGVPTTGAINRILSSRFTERPGRPVRGRELRRRPTAAPASTSTSSSRIRSTCRTSRCRREGRGLTLLLHSLGGSFNQMHGSKNQSQFGERGEGHIVITPEQPRPRRLVLRPRRRRGVRGVGGRRAPLRARPAEDRDHRLLDGRLRHLQVRDAVPRPLRLGPADGWAAFARRLRPGAEGSDTNPMLPSLRHVPIMSWVGVEDELVPYAGSLQQRQAIADAELEHLLRLLPHRRALHLRDQRRVRPGGRVPRRAQGRAEPRARHLRPNPSMDFAELGHRRPTAPTGCAASRPRATGSARSTPSPTASAAPTTCPAPLQNSAGVLTGGVIPALAFERQSARGRSPAGSSRRRTSSTLDAQNVSKIAGLREAGKAQLRPGHHLHGRRPARGEARGLPGPAADAHSVADSGCKSALFRVSRNPQRS